MSDYPYLCILAAGVPAGGPWQDADAHKRSGPNDPDPTIPCPLVAVQPLQWHGSRRECAWRRSPHRGAEGTSSSDTPDVSPGTPASLHSHAEPDKPDQLSGSWAAAIARADQDGQQARAWILSTQHAPNA